MESNPDAHTSASHTHTPPSALEEDKSQPPTSNVDVRIAVIGNVDSGKSTLVGVLSKGLIDDGRGLARSHVFNFSHEQANGRTSSVTHELMGFRSDGQVVVPERLKDSKNKAWQHIVEHSEKTLTFLDLCGHEKYLKTTIFGLVGHLPDYAMIVVGANMGLSKMTKEHIGLALCLKIPLFFVVTKIDIAPPEVYEENLKFLRRVLSSRAAGNKIPIVVDETTDLSEVHTLLDTRACPIFPVSNVTGQGLDALRMFLFGLRSRVLESGNFGSPEDPPEFFIDGVFMVTGIGLVVSGTLKAGRVNLNQQLMIGPDNNGNYKAVNVKGIHRNRVPESTVFAGQSCCFQIKSTDRKEQLKKHQIKKGMLLVDKRLCPATAWEFDTEVVILQDSTTIRPNYQPILHCGVVRQSARVISVSNEQLRTGDKGVIRFRFMFRPELIHTGMTILFREGKTKGLGVITYIHPH